MDHEIGEHHLIEFVGCPAEKLKYKSLIEPVLMEAVHRSGAESIGQLSHQFKPFGVTCMVLIAESHFSLHTWPEKGYAAMDIFTCGEMDSEAAIAYVAKHLEAESYAKKTIPRIAEGVTA
ncbi:MAG: adenosylmethionine decarboxylase [Verrucomicrobiales bacterium]|nr:adenosylmethionine decarboxylase [Verrucomicrobiales bacterium]